MPLCVGKLTLLLFYESARQVFICPFFLMAVYGYEPTQVTVAGCILASLLNNPGETFSEETLFSRSG